MRDTKYKYRYGYVHRFPYGKARTGTQFVSHDKIELSLTKGSLSPKYKYNPDTRGTPPKVGGVGMQYETQRREARGRERGRVCVATL